ncbi:abnormal spindle-like microcephaly-associated protein homolog isoform X2 [Drosophila eugracilis]|uniref:abnormal spindle-like microcephaly-associated protein homolog isoform X2 n=1 Tax=Drosophila eugracilis TaxID=29029 RepID=UPI001BDAB1CD|nr:abnormal spindle-like microcephaly-associated protein homolog isoform X2 [Drosophila eugracilis]
MFIGNFHMMQHTRRGTAPEGDDQRLRSGSYKGSMRCYDCRMHFMSRTNMLILDYKQYKAARRIQKIWRRFYTRKNFEDRRKAAITIQRWWRGFSVRNKYYSFVENTLQKRVVEHYHKSATKIQALFRGWWSRRTIHDHSKLLRMQVCAAEDLLNCVAFKLHHLLRTYSIPGVYSLKNSNCLSRIEKLLASLHFRFHNGKEKQQIAKNIADRNGERKNFQKSDKYSKVPFEGARYWSQCRPKCDLALKMSKDIDKRMYRIIDMYDASQREAHKALVEKNLKHKKQNKLLRNIQKSAEHNKRDFCGDVIASMRRWKILVDNNLHVDKNIFRNPENLERFLSEISQLVTEFESCTCYCRIPVLTEIYCG